jgi:predicted DNA-binding ArsR family transcriptional regulator
MQGNRTRRHWPADRIPLERTIMALVLAVYPHWLTVHELAREIGRQGILTRAILELIKVGLLERRGSSVRASKAAAHLERLKLP